MRRSRTLPAAAAPSPTVLSRRTVLAAGAWAAPVLVLAVATPAAAASGPEQVADVVRPDSVNAGSYAPGTVSVNDAGIHYDYARWGLSGQDENAGPATATVGYRIDVIDAVDGTVVATAGDSVEVIAKYQSAHVRTTIPGVPAGSYIVRATVFSVAFAAARTATGFRALAPTMADSPIVQVS